MERYLALHRRHRRRRARATGRRCSRSTGSTASAALDETIVEGAARLPRHGPGARRQRRVPPGAARRLRLRGARGHARVLRRAAREAAATSRCSSGWKCSAGAPSPCTTSRTPACGSCAARARVHTFSSVMCWAACDRLARIADRLGLAGRTPAWREEAANASSASSRRAAGARRGSPSSRPSTATTLDASLLLLADLGFVRADDPRFAATVQAIERELRRGDFMFRYVEKDDFGAPRERVRRLHVLVRQRARARSGAATRRARCSSGCSPPQPARPARRAPRSRHRRAVGQLRADLQHGGADQLGDPAVDAVG